MKEINLSDVIHPSEKQREALQALDTYKYLLYGGAKYGGKSYFLRWALVKLLLQWAKRGFKNVRVGLFCEDYPSLKDRQITKIKVEFPKWLGILKDDLVEGLSFQLKPSFGGGIIALRNLDDPSKYASSEFAAMAVDELERNKEEVFYELRSILRWPGIEDVRFIAAAMPGGVGHHLVKKLWIDRAFDAWEPEKEQFYLIRAYAKDNPYISEGYLNQLKSLPEKLRKAYLEGNWDVFAGQYFTEWDRVQHTCQPFAIPDGWKKFRAYDHGRDAPACMKWYALDYDGRVFVYREFYQAGLDVDQIAPEINRLSKGENYVYSVADPSIFAKMGFVDRYGGQTIAETFARNGVMFIPASNRRIDGWTLMHQYLRWDEHKQPKLIHFNTCYNSIRTIPALIHDDKQPEDLDTQGEDHAADCDRYFLLSLHEMKPPIPLTGAEKKLQEMIAQDEKIDFNAFYSGDLYRKGLTP